MAGAVSPRASRSAPTTVMTPPRMKRRRIGTSSSACRSDTATTGAIRTARRAGLMAETIVTPTPTTRQTMTVRASKTSGPEGSVTPKPLKSFSSPMAASTPRPRPTSDDTSPTISASPRTERNTWRRLAPTMRSSASSRVRWPTMMEKVLRMVKPPTNSAMKAKTSNAVLRKPRAWPMALVASLTTVWPVTTSAPCGRTPRDGALDGRLVGAGLGHDIDGVELAHLAHELLGRGRVEAGQGGPGKVVGRPETHQPGDGEGPRRPLQQNPHPLTHLEAVLLRRAEVHHDVVGRRRSRALDEPELRDLRIGVEGEAEGGRPSGRDRLAVGRDVLRVAGDGAVGRLHTGDGLHLGEERLLDWIARRRAAAAELGHPAHLEVDVLVDVAEERVERVVQGVGEDERPGDERHPEDDGERRQRQAELVREQSLDGDPPHVRRPDCRCAPGRTRVWDHSSRRRCCRRRGRRRGRRRTPHGGRG